MASEGHLDTKSSDQLFDFICTTCDGNDKKVEAVRYCIECHGYCCQACTDIHKSFPTLKTHSLLDVCEGNKSGHQQTRLPEFPTERCAIHLGKVIDMYCKCHDEVGCSACIAKDHKLCPENDIYSIPDMLGTLYNVTECKQTRNRLRDMLTSVTTIQSSTSSKLEALRKAKSTAIEEVHTIQKALEALIMRAIEASIKEIETECKDLEDEILENKEAADNALPALKDSDIKLDKADGNRAQSFVCSKVVEMKIKNVKIKQTKHSDITIQPLVKARKSIQKYILSADGISKILGDSVIKQSIYDVKECRDINIRVHDDTETCSAWGSCQIDDAHIVVTDNANKKLKRISRKTMAVVDYCIVYGTPNDVCFVKSGMVAITCAHPNTIKLISIGNKMKVTSTITMDHYCFRIACNNDIFYVTNNKATVYAYDINGTLLNKIVHDKHDKRIFQKSQCLAFNECKRRLLVGDEHGEIVVLDANLDYVSTVKYVDIEDATYICQAIQHCEAWFVLDWKKKRIIQLDIDGSIIGVVIDPKHGLQHPSSMCSLQLDGKPLLCVTEAPSDALKMYELK